MLNKLKSFFWKNYQILSETAFKTAANKRFGSLNKLLINRYHFQI